MDATLYGELKLSCFKNYELYFRIGYTDVTKTEYKFVLNIMVKDVGCNGMMHSYSIMTLHIFCKKFIPLKLTVILKCHICYLTFI